MPFRFNRNIWSIETVVKFSSSGIGQIFNRNIWSIETVIKLARVRLKKHSTETSEVLKHAKVKEWYEYDGNSTETSEVLKPNWFSRSWKSYCKIQPKHLKYWNSRLFWAKRLKLSQSHSTETSEVLKLVLIYSFISFALYHIQPKHLKYWNSSSLK